MKKIALLFAVAILSLASLLSFHSTSAAPDNLIANPSVESADATDLLPASWGHDNWGNNTASFDYKSADAHSGTKSLYVNMAKRKSGDAKWYFSEIAVKPSQKYTYSEFYKASVSTEIDIQYTHTNGKVSYTWLNNAAASKTAYKNYKKTFTTPADAKSLTIYHLIQRAGWLQTDDFSLVEGDGTSTPAPTPPTVTVTAPAGGSSVAGMQTLNANASDDVSVTGVQFKVDGVNVGAEDVSAPYSINWDSKTVANGSHSVTAVARDNSNLTTTSAPVMVNVQNVTAPTPPTVSITAPTNGSTVSGTQNVAATANDNQAIKSVQFKLDGANLGAADTTAPFEATWNTAQGSNGLHTLSAVATNISNLTATATTVSVTVNNVVTPPPTTPNLILNPSLETADGNVPASWLSSNWGTNTSTFSYPATGHTGNRSVKVETTAYTNGAANWYYADVPVTAGKTYKYENWYQSNVDTEVDAEVVMADGSVQYFWLGTVPASTSWTKFSTTFTVPSDGSKMAVYQILAKKGYIVSDDYSLSEYTPQAWNRALVSVTFDDGWTSQFSNALPILNKYGLKATFYIISGELTDQPDYMTGSQVNNLYLQGMEIGSHTVSHVDLTQATQASLVNQMSQSQTTLQNLIGASVTSFAYPYGAYNANTIAVGKQYYQSQRSVNSGYNTKDNMDVTQLKIYEVDSDIPNAQVEAWIRGAIDQNAWLILVYHEVGMSIGGDKYHVSTSNLDAQMNYLKNSGVQVVTVNQALNELVPQQ